MPMPDLNTALGYARIMRAGGSVQRYHTARTVRSQTNADHSWGVAALVAQVYPEASSTLFRAALFHDVSETFTGDIPTPARRDHPALAEAEHDASTHYNVMLGLEFPLTPKEYDVLKWCDLMELLMWCAEDARLGNTFVVSMLHNGVKYLNEKEAPTQEAGDLKEQFLTYIGPLLTTEKDWYA